MKKPTKPTIEPLVTKTKPALVTSLAPKDEALRAAQMFFDRFSGITLRNANPGESGTQYRAYVLARLQPILNNSEGIKKIIRAAIQS